jgi:hypothetical protein
MLKLKPEFLSKRGKREFAVLTMEDYKRVTEALEDAEDLRILREAKRRGAHAPTISMEEMEKRLGIATKGHRKAR